jgi:hypothetical protein
MIKVAWFWKKESSLTKLLGGGGYSPPVATTLIYSCKNKLFKIANKVVISDSKRIWPNSPLYSAVYRRSRWNPSKYAVQLKHNGIKHILNKF